MIQLYRVVLSLLEFLQLIGLLGTCIGFFVRYKNVVDVVGKDGSLFKLACPYGILNSLYDMSDLELLNSVADISHWVETPISLHAAAKQASFSLSCKRCKYKANSTTKVIVLQNRANVERQKFRVGANITLDVCV